MREKRPETTERHDTVILLYKNLRLHVAVTVKVEVGVLTPHAGVSRSCAFRLLLFTAAKRLEAYRFLAYETETGESIHVQCIQGCIFYFLFNQNHFIENVKMDRINLCSQIINIINFSQGWFMLHSRSHLYINLCTIQTLYIYVYEYICTKCLTLLCLGKVSLQSMNLNGNIKHIYVCVRTDHECKA